MSMRPRRLGCALPDVDQQILCDCSPKVLLLESTSAVLPWEAAPALGAHGRTTSAVSWSMPGQYALLRVTSLVGFLDVLGEGV
jgi:hypothetical protein